MAVVEVHELCKVYDGRSVVDGVSFEVREGEIFGILGPNGAGKTTTVEMIEGLRRPDGGHVRVLGFDPHREGRQVRRRLGAQLQESQLQAKLKVWEALHLYAAMYEPAGPGEAEEGPADPDELLEMLGLVEQRDTRFGQLSGGQKQRLSIALALVGRPQVAVLDELTTGLDPASRRDTWSLIERVRDTGVTVLLVTHFMEEAQRLCDRVAVIDRGRVVALDTPDGLVGRAAAEQELRFVPSAPLDLGLLTAVDEVQAVERDGRDVVVVGTDGVVQTALAVLTREGIRAEELRVQRQTLDDAFLAITGRAPEATDDDEEVVA